MSRILFFLLLAVLAWIWFKKPSRSDTPRRPQARTPSAAPVERIVQCVHCGLRVPEGEALVSGNDHFCCAEHRNAQNVGR